MGNDNKGDDRDQVLYQIAEVFERCGFHPQALYEGLHPLAMEHKRDGLGKLLNSMLGCLQQAGEAPDRWQVLTDTAYALDGTADISLSDALAALAKAFPTRRHSDPGFEADAVARFIAALRQHWAVGGLAVAADQRTHAAWTREGAATAALFGDKEAAQWLHDNPSVSKRKHKRNRDDQIPF
jgi:hypothetical protein